MHFAQVCPVYAGQGIRRGNVWKDNLKFLLTLKESKKTTSMEYVSTGVLEKK